MRKIKSAIMCLIVMTSICLSNIVAYAEELSYKPKYEKTKSENSKKIMDCCLELGIDWFAMPETVAKQLDKNGFKYNTMYFGEHYDEDDNLVYDGVSSINIIGSKQKNGNKREDAFVIKSDYKNLRVNSVSLSFNDDMDDRPFINNLEIVTINVDETVETVVDFFKHYYDVKTSQHKSSTYNATSLKGNDYDFVITISEIKDGTCRVSYMIL